MSFETDPFEPEPGEPTPPSSDLPVGHALEPWMERARCRDEGHDDFYGEDAVAVARAKAICAKCVVGWYCYDYGVRNDESGIWGGVLLEDGKETTIRRHRAS